MRRDLENCRVCSYPATPVRDERGIRYEHAGREFPCRWESIDAPADDVPTEASITISTAALSGRREAAMAISVSALRVDGEWLEARR